MGLEGFQPVRRPLEAVPDNILRALLGTSRGPPLPERHRSYLPIPYDRRTMHAAYPRAYHDAYATNQLPLTL